MSWKRHVVNLTVPCDTGFRNNPNTQLNLLSFDKLSDAEQMAK